MVFQYKNTLIEKELSEFSNPPCRMSKSDLYFCEYLCLHYICGK